MDFWSAFPSPGAVTVAPSGGAEGNTRWQIFSKSFYFNTKSDCIYHAPIDLEHKRTRPFVFQINRKMVITI